MSASFLPEFEDSRSGSDEQAIVRALAGSLGPYGREVVLEDEYFQDGRGLSLKRGLEIANAAAALGIGGAALRSFLKAVEADKLKDGSKVLLLVGLSVARGLNLAVSSGESATALELGVKSAVSQAALQLKRATIPPDRSKKHIENFCFSIERDRDLAKLVAATAATVAMHGHPHRISVAHNPRDSDEIVEVKQISLKASLVASNTPRSRKRRSHDEACEELFWTKVSVFPESATERAVLEAVACANEGRDPDNPLSCLVMLPLGSHNIDVTALELSIKALETQVLVLEVSETDHGLALLNLLRVNSELLGQTTFTREGVMESVEFRESICKLTMRFFGFVDGSANSKPASSELLSRYFSGSYASSVELRLRSSPLTELNDRIPRAWSAIDAAIEQLREGSVPGGGAALAKAAFAVVPAPTESEAFKTGARIVATALQAPLAAILATREKRADDVLKLLERGGDFDCYDALTDTVGSALELGVLDPKYVPKLALSLVLRAAQWALRTQHAGVLREPEQSHAGSIRPVVDDRFMPPRLVRPDPRSIRLWFATDRRRVDPTNSFGDFENTADNAVHYGTCVVDTSDSHTGLVGLTWIFKMFRSSSLNTSKKVAIETESEEVFVSDLQYCASNLPEGRKHLLLVLHGYNVDFNGAAKHAAQIASDLAIDGPTVFFSWPSRGSALDYIPDEATIARSERRFQGFLELLLSIEGFEAVSVIAHSMGNRLLLAGVKHLALNPNISRFCQMILAAPDIDSATFKDSIPDYQKAKQVHARLTLYWNARDKALAASKIAHKAHRIGFIGQFSYTDGLDSVRWCGDSRWSLIKLGHSYHVDSAPVIEDIRSVLVWNKHPRERALTPRPNDRPTHWDLDAKAD